MTNNIKFSSVNYCPVPSTYELKKIENIELMLDYEFLSKNVGWSNHSDETFRYEDANRNIWFHYNEEKNIIESFEFDGIVCSGMHGFCGTSYTHQFYLDDEYIHEQHREFSNTRENLIQKLIRSAEYEISCAERILSKQEEKINKYEKL